MDMAVTHASCSAAQISQVASVTRVDGFEEGRVKIAQTERFTALRSLCNHADQGSANGSSQCLRDKLHSTRRVNLFENDLFSFEQLLTTAVSYYVCSFSRTVTW
eukprot:scpid42979/ scgid6979/ 